MRLQLTIAFLLLGGFTSNAFALNASQCQGLGYYDNTNCGNAKAYFHTCLGPGGKYGVNNMVVEPHVRAVLHVQLGSTASSACGQMANSLCPGSYSVPLLRCE